jgi:DNA-binding winged helix-turn-helix (wHTH) protein
MSQPSRIRFGPFLFDRREARLWRDEAPVDVTPRALAILDALLNHREGLVTRDELVDRVWPRTIVTDAALAKRIQELRTVLGDDSRAPHYIKTFYGRGYQFIGPAIREDRPPDDFVGRAAALDALRRAYHRMLGAERHTVLITGEAGIGKTRLLTRFLAECVDADAVIAHGACVPQGGAEPYLPILAALRGLADDPATDFDGILRRHAPSWLPFVYGAQASGRAGVAHNQHMLLRELGLAVKHFAQRRPLIIALEDLHWSDPSTLAALDSFARTAAPGRILVIATLRHGAIDSKGEAWRALAGHLGRDGCSEIRLSRLTPTETLSYLEARFDASFAAHLAPLVHERAGGLPLFNTWLADWIVWRRADGVDEGDIERGLPDSLGRLFELQLATLPDDVLPVIEAASVFGGPFSVDALADVLRLPLQTTEAACREIVRSGCIVAPVGGPAARSFEFAHALLQEALYRRIDDARRQRLHGHCAAALSARGIAHEAEVARHLSSAGAHADAAAHFLRAGRHAVEKQSLLEARRHFEAGLTELDHAKRDQHRDATEIDLQLGLGHCVVATQGYAMPSVELCYERAHELATHSGNPGQRFAALSGVITYLIMRGHLARSETEAERLLSVAGECEDAAVLARSYLQRAEVRFYRGDLQPAWNDLCHAETLLTKSDEDPLGWTSWSVVRVSCQEYLGQIECERLELDSALERSELLLAWFDRRRQPYAECLARYFAAAVRMQRDEFDEAAAHTEAMIRLASIHGLHHPLILGEIIRGHLRAVRGDPGGAVEQIRRGLTLFDATGAVLSRVVAMDALARALARAGDVSLATLADANALLARTGERLREPQLAMSFADALSARHGPASVPVRAALEGALDKAQHMGSRLWKLRALTRLAAADGAYRAQLRTLLDSLTQGEGAPIITAARAELH